MITWQEFDAMKDEKGNINISDFYKTIKKDLGIEDNPKADKLMSIAWQEGHAYGYYEVYLHARDLVELIT